jgi:hypothetical protein
MRVLFVTTVLPHRRTMGSEVASQSIIDALRAHGVHVDVLGYLRVGDGLDEARDTVAVQTRHIETRGAKWHPIGWLLQSFARAIPYSSAKYRSALYVHQVHRQCAMHAYDTAIIDHPQMAWIARDLPRSLPTVFIAHNIEHEMYEQIAGGQRNPLARWIYRREAIRIRHAEQALATISTEIWALTAHDAGYFATIGRGARVRVLPLPATSLAHAGQGMEKLFDIGLIGSWSWQANREGLCWFLEQVLPRLPSSLSIRVAGNGAERLLPRASRVQAVGFVPDAIGFMQQARVVAIPTLSGGGIQIKTLDAIGSGSRIVATACAVRGIDDPPPNLVVADTAVAFAEELQRAACGPPAGEALESALRWSTGRRDRFGAELARALEDLQRPGASRSTTAAWRDRFPAAGRPEAEETAIR